MRVTVGRSDVNGAVRVPGSKSYTVRAAVCAALAHGDSLIKGALRSDDAAAVLESITGLGATVREADGGLAVRGGSLHASAAPLWCRESAATFRFLAAVAGTVPGVTILRCAPSLARRPLEPLLEGMRQLGAECSFDAGSGVLTVRGTGHPSGRVVLQGDVSSQFISALLLSGPRVPGGLSVLLSSPIVSEQYVEMTRECMRCFGVDVAVLDGGRTFHVGEGGYRAARYVVEGDWSGGAAVLALGALAGQVRVRELPAESLQADVAVLDILEKAGASVRSGGGEVMVSRARLRPFDYDVSGCIDLLPVACALGAAANGVTTLTGIARARDKESDRVAAMVDGLAQLGVGVDAERDRMRVSGGGLHGGAVSSAGDHRIAMALGILGAVTGDVTVDEAQSVAKTYPAFWETLAGLGVEVTLHE
ncbi:MAG: 3-phosphoshikimate 1-carboxyvinyltransferase [Dehalococcoidia bacterium]|nr:3-phosphoshikimate 1-carboxyvinyltransferase [Dehalococcoidia bacterium]